MPSGQGRESRFNCVFTIIGLHSIKFHSSNSSINDEIDLTNRRPIKCHFQIQNDSILFLEIQKKLKIEMNLGIQNSKECNSKLYFKKEREK